MIPSEAPERLPVRLIRDTRPSMAVQKFPTTRGVLVRELLNQSHTSKAHDSSVPYEPEVRNHDCRKVCANFGFGTLVWRFRSSPVPCGFLVRELLNQSHTSRAIILVSLMNPKLAKASAARRVRASGSGH